MAKARGKEQGRRWKNQVQKGKAWRTAMDGEKQAVSERRAT